MKMKKFSRTLFCRWVTARLVILMLEVTLGAGISNSYAADPSGTNVVQSAASAQATGSSSTNIVSHVVQACGPLCLFLVLLVAVAVVGIIIAGLLRLCHLLNRPKHGKDPDDQVMSNLAPRAKTQLSPKSFSSNVQSIQAQYNTPVVITLDDTNTVTGYSIIPGSVNGDGTTNKTSLDRDGFPYCVEFETIVQTTTNLGDWDHATETCVIKGWVSFDQPREVASVGNDGMYTIQGTPKNVLIVCYTNGVAASRGYYPATTTKDSMDLSSIPSLTLPGPDSAKRFYRLMAPIPD